MVEAHSRRLLCWRWHIPKVLHSQTGRVYEARRSGAPKKDDQKGKMKTVWILRGYDWEVQDILGVYSTKERAEEALAAHGKAWPNCFHGIEIQEWQIDLPARENEPTTT